MSKMRCRGRVQMTKKCTGILYENGASSQEKQEPGEEQEKPQSKKKKPKSRKNSPLLMNLRTLLRNEDEPSLKRFFAESSDKGVSAQDLHPNLQPIYQKLRKRSPIL